MNKLAEAMIILGVMFSLAVEQVEISAVGVLVAIVGVLVYKPEAEG